MALFKKYFGQVNHDPIEKQSGLNINLLEYTNAVDNIANTYFDFEENKQSIYSDLDEVLFDLTTREIDRVILRIYEPKVICAAILGYYFLNDLSFMHIYKGSLLDLLQNCRQYRAVLIKIAENIANSDDELLYNAMFRKYNPVTPNLPKQAVVYGYLQHRFYLYSPYIIDGLGAIINGEEESYLHLFGKGYQLSINPHEEYPSNRDDEDYFEAMGKFKNKVEMAYRALKMILKHE